MTSLQQRYSELLALTKSYLQQEYSLTDRIPSEAETYTYFKTYALQRQSIKNQQAAPKQQAATAMRSQPLQGLTTEPKPSRQTPEGLTTHSNAPVNPIAPEREIIETAKPDKPAPHKEETHPNPATPNQEKAPTPKPEKSPQPENLLAQNQNPVTGAFKLDPPPALPQTDFSALRTIINEKLPHVRLTDQLPDDTEAKQLAKIWAQEKRIPQVLILSFDEAPKHQAFLANIAKALNVHGIDTQVANAPKLERENEWQKLLQSKELKLVIAGSSGFHSLPQLQKHYREGTKHGRHYLGDRLLLLLSDISYYLKEPALKPSLWAALRELLSNKSASS